MNIPIIETKRLRLEPLSIEHSKDMYRLWSDAFVCQYSGKVTDFQGNIIKTPVKSQEQSDLIIDFWVKAASEGWGLRWAVILKDISEQFVGTVGFNSCTHSFEIAYHLIPDFSKQGLMTEASKAAIKWAEDQGATEVVAFIETVNQRSIVLARRLGMKADPVFSEGAQKYSKKL